MSYNGTGPSGQISVLQSNGGISYFNSKHSENIINIGKNDTAQFSSIKTAVDSITDSSSSNRYSLRIGPGTYSEGPMVLPTYVNLRGEQNSVTIIPSDNGVPLIQMSGVNSLSMMQMFTPSNSIGTVSSSGAITNLDRLLFLGPSVGTLCEEGSTIVGTELVYNYLSSGPSGICFWTHADSATLSTIQCLGAGTGIFVKDGIFSISNFTISNCSNGIYVHDCISSDARLGNIVSCPTGLFVCENLGPTSVVEMSSVKIRGSNIWAIESMAQSGVVNLASCQFMGDKVSAVNYDALKMFFFDEKADDQAARLLAEFAVGVAELGKESAFGEGDSYTRGMLVYQSGVSTGLFTDVSSAAKDTTSTFGFPGNASGDAIYISSDLQNSSDYVKFYGIKSSNDTLMVVDSGSMICELWDGAGWIQYFAMSTASSDDYMHYANQLWQNTTNEQIRFDAILAASGQWIKNDPIGDGIDRYWVRMVVTSPMTTLPVFNQFKLHSSRTEINDDGYIEFFGNARPLASLPFDMNITRPASASPGNQDVYLSDTLDVGRTENSFATVATDRIGFISRLPIEMDTSSRLHVLVTFVGTGAAGSSIDFTIRHGYSNEENSDLIYTNTAGAPTTHSTEKSTAVSVTSLAANVQQSLELDLDISSVVTRRSGGHGDLLWITIERDGSADAYSGTINIVQIGLSYLKWSLGGHSSSLH